MNELALLIAEQERDMRIGDHVWRGGEVTLTAAVLETAVGVDLFGEMYVPPRPVAMRRTGLQLSHGAAAYRKRGCRCAECKRATNECKRRYRAAHPDYVSRQNAARNRRRQESRAREPEATSPTERAETSDA